LSPEPILRSGRCLIIGEVALTHDGSLGLAHAFVMPSPTPAPTP